VIDLKLKNICLVVSLFLIGCSSDSYYEEDYTVDDFHKLVVGAVWAIDKNSLPEKARNRVPNYQLKYVPTNVSGEYKRIMMIKGKEVGKKQTIKMVEYKNLEEKYKSSKSEGQNYNFALFNTKKRGVKSFHNIVDGNLYEFDKNHLEHPPVIFYSLDD